MAASSSFAFKEEPIAYDKLVAVLGGKTQLVHNALNAFIQNGSELVTKCRQTTASGSLDFADFKSSSHSLKGSAGLIKATKLYPLALGLSDLGKRGALADMEKLEILLAAVEHEFELVKKFVGQITEGGTDVVHVPDPPVDVDALCAEFTLAPAEILEQFTSQASKVFDALRRRVNKGNMHKALGAADSLLRSSVSIKSTVLYPLCLTCVETLSHEPDETKLNVVLGAIEVELEKIAAFVTFLEEQGVQGPLVNMDALVEQFGGNREFADNVVEQFVTLGRERMAKFREALAGGDKKTIWNEAHAMKGEVSMLNLRSMSRVCSQLTTAVGESPYDATRVSHCVDAVEVEFVKVCAFVAAAK